MNDRPCYNHEDAIRNTITGDVLYVRPIGSGQHLVTKVNGFREHHRGSLATARAYLARTVSGFPAGMWVPACLHCDVP